jgi:predicted amidohydrolase
MHQNNYLQIAAYQGKIAEKSPASSLEKTLQIMSLANSRDVDILCMPESYLHGYLDTREDALKYSIDLQSNEFASLCDQFKSFSTTLLLGLNERDGDKIYNTVVVIEQGRFLGKYRKAYTYCPYDYFSLGREFPVFEKRGVKYGIIICLDSTYREPAYITALNGAKILFCPSFNRVQQDARMLHYLRRKSHFITRAFDNHCWFVCSDIIWDEHDNQTCPGYACILDNNGEIVATAEAFNESLLTYSIPIHNLLETKNTRLLGTPDLFKMMQDTYIKTCLSD